MAKTRLDIAKKDIAALFENMPSHAFSRIDIGKALNENRSFWRLAQSTTREKFIDYLCQKTDLNKITLDFPGKKTTIFVWGNPSLYEIFSAIDRRAYFSHYTAVHYHGLTEQIPSVYYLTVELSEKAMTTEKLSSEKIAEAFSKEVRESKNVARFEDAQVYLLYGKCSKKLGVESVMKTGGASLQFTSLERTLIDIAIRPNYSGGIYEVINAYKNALEKVSINKLCSMLTKLNYIYPYHQAIGFLLQRSGYESSRLQLLKRFSMSHDFYLIHGMKNPAYSKEWKLFYPQGI